MTGVDHHRILTELADLVDSSNGTQLEPICTAIYLEDALLTTLPDDVLGSSRLGSLSAVAALLDEINPEH